MIATVCVLTLILVAAGASSEDVKLRVFLICVWLLMMVWLFAGPVDAQVIIVIPPADATPTATATVYAIPATPQPDETLLPFIHCKPVDTSQTGVPECCYEWRGNGIDPTQSYWHFLNCVR